MFSKAKEGTWSHLLSNDTDTAKIRSIIEEGMILRVGNGNSVHFWHDRWCEAGLLKRIFPRLFTISLQKNFLTSRMGEWNEGTWTCILRWRRVLYEWERNELLTLNNLIEEKRPSRDIEDGVYWKHSGDIYYPTKSIVAKMNESTVLLYPNPLSTLYGRNLFPQKQNFVYGW